MKKALTGFGSCKYLVPESQEEIDVLGNAACIVCEKSADEALGHSYEVVNHIENGVWSVMLIHGDDVDTAEYGKLYVLNVEKPACLVRFAIDEVL